MPIAPILLPQDAWVRAAMIVRGQYSFAVDGGAISTIAITSGLPIPLGATVVGGYIDVTTQCTGASASIACQVEAANDILTTVAIASWTTGRKNILPALTTGALTAGTQVKTTADRNISIVITAGAVTAGVFEVILFVVPPLA
jgi:hypothetical protein